MTAGKKGFDIFCTFSSKKVIRTKFQSRFSGKNKESIVNMSSAELAQKVAKAN